MSSRMPTYKEQQILDKVCKVTRQKQIKYYDFIPFFDFQYEKNIFNCQPSHFSPCSAVPAKAPIFLIGTHKETVDKKDIKIIDCQVRRNLWNSYCDELIMNDVEGLVFFPVENSHGRSDFGIQCLQKKVVDVAEHCKETIGCDIPLPWVRIQDAIISHTEKKGATFCVTLDEFPRAFENFVCTDWSKDALKYFHEKGLVIYLERNQSSDLSNWVLLKPEILVDIIIQLVIPPPEITQERGLRHDWNLLQKKGLLTKSLLKNILSKVKENEEAMTAFLEEYDLICPLANRKVKMCRVHQKMKSSQHTLYPPCYQWHQKGTHPYGMMMTLIRSVMYSSPSSFLNLCSTICYLEPTSLVGWSFLKVISFCSEMLASSG